ncbi:hypothetical protein IMZ29_07020 [Achromobacter sp. GG226]|uniref:hypothetical protein n=1 Tax=Verticiella alkaliphila TaxID=2779529 RepID=UPI001C0CA75B|nr:hypothetical protein [Verticiella sp. GG226]MBU4610298.1 hypothetical protein [Verticiella sp. GG226]
MNHYRIKVRLADATYQWIAIAVSPVRAMLDARDRFADQDLVVSATPLHKSR